MGNTPDRPLRVAPVGAIGAFLVMAFSRFQFWKSAASPSTMRSWSSSLQGIPLSLCDVFFWSSGGSEGVLGSQRRVRRVFQAYRGRRGPVLRGPVCEGLAILHSLPARFLRSSPSGISEGRDGLPYSPLRREYVVEFHSLPYSTFSMLMAPIYGVFNGDHPLVKRLVRGGVQGEAPAPGFPSDMGSSQGPRHFPAVACRASPFQAYGRGRSSWL